jgi:hypothetical protein
MTSAASWLVFVVLFTQVLFSIAAGIACVAACRWASRAWPPLGLIVGTGVLLRAWAGLLMFAISYLQLPVLSSLHTGDGYWQLAPDARAYYELAASTPAYMAIPASAPSPAFVEMLRLWMRVAGQGLASPVLFNLLLFAGLVVMLISAFGPLNTQAARAGALVCTSAFSFSPVLILLGTQTLKDVFFAFVVVWAAIALFLILPALGGRARWRDVAFWAATGFAAVFLIAGVRAYYAALMCAAAAVGVFAQAWNQRWADGLRVVGAGIPLIALLLCAFKLGAGPLSAPFENLVLRAVSRVQISMEPVQSLRAGFERTGGATNLTPADSGTVPADSGTSPQAPLRQVLRGVAAVFVPISVLRGLSIVQFSGGRGLIVATDLDTILVDFTIIAVVWLLVSWSRVARRHVAFLCLALSLAVVSAVLMGYIVTNYGTLFRLRLMATIPLWLLPLALADRSGAEIAFAGAPEWTQPPVDPGQSTQTRFD